jgi:hypothetical protein
LEGPAAPDERTAALVALADTSGVLAAIYGRRERRALKPRLAELRDSGLAGGATHAAIQAAQAAAVAAAAAAAAAAG